MQRKRRKKKRFGVFLFLLVVCIGIGIMFVPWAMQPENFREVKNKINGFLYKEDFPDSYNAKSGCCFTKASISSKAVESCALNSIITIRPILSPPLVSFFVLDNIRFIA
jgi:hypothetical protein